MDNSRFKTKTGRVTLYGLACGYIEEYESKGYRVTAWHEGAIFHVRLHDHGTDDRQGMGRIFWDCEMSLKDMRKRFDNAKRFIKAQ